MSFEQKEKNKGNHKKHYYKGKNQSSVNKMTLSDLEITLLKKVAVREQKRQKRWYNRAIAQLKYKLMIWEARKNK